jgi:hypothetical protein
MKLFFLFDIKSVSRTIELFRTAARSGGHEVFDLRSPEFKARLTEARVLCVFFEKREDLRDKGLEEHWRFFEGEITWKRKAGGDIVLILGDGVEKNDLPFRLKPCKILRTSESAKLNNLLKEFETPPPSPAKTITVLSAPDIFADLKITELPPIAPLAPVNFTNAPAKPQSPGTKPPVNTAANLANRAAAPPANRPQDTVARPGASGYAPPQYRAPANPTPRSAKTKEKMTPVKGVKTAVDYLWLIALIPLSAGVMYGVNAFAKNLLVGVNYFPAILSAAAFVFFLYSAFRSPFGASRFVTRSAKWFRLAALIVCIAIDFMFMNYRAVSNFFTWRSLTDANTFHLAGLPYVIA